MIKKQIIYSIVDIRIPNIPQNIISECASSVLVFVVEGYRKFIIRVLVCLVYMDDRA